MKRSFTVENIAAKNPNEGSDQNNTLLIENIKKLEEDVKRKKIEREKYK